ncbi:hypothetical protein CEXT_255951 [Caerostris extrusa]|uniref:BHLH domain-containing protein n=1 Tax=Caerostris extrusa TaxID=172846 RepID=A0AAV4WMG4_CAEEX|nr:hypothetical protein CEXT_255951 [Caerostris extrusa]
MQIFLSSNCDEKETCLSTNITIGILSLPFVQGESSQEHFQYMEPSKRQSLKPCYDQLRSSIPKNGEEMSRMDILKTTIAYIRVLKARREARQKRLAISIIYIYTIMYADVVTIRESKNERNSHQFTKFCHILRSGLIYGK